MSNEKQVEEMLADIRKIENRFVDEKLPVREIEKYLAKSLIVDEGYRKQSEGEWIKHPVSYECTACKEEFFVEGYAEDYDPITDWDLHFCPNCGAKMKGGE